jgi:hypothetical protein
MPKQTVTTSAVALTAYEVGKSVFLKAPSTNAVPLWFGYSNTITAGTADATDGMILSAGETFTVDALRCGRTSGNIYVRCASGSPVVYFDAR